MQQQDDWFWLLDSVLFAIRVTKHASTGVSPFHMLYNKDLILPFEYADRCDNLVTEHDEYGLNMSNGCRSSTADPVNTITSLLSQLEGQQQKLLFKAEKQIQKAQKHQAKWYNMRNAAGEPFEIGCKVLKKI